jgi:hypothetical protein
MSASDDVYGFSRADASSILDLLNPPSLGADRPDPIRQIISVVVRIDGTMAAASCNSPSTGSGRVLELIPVSSPGGVLDRFELVEAPSGLVVDLKSFRPRPIFSGTVCIAVRDQIRNEWWVA